MPDERARILADAAARLSGQVTTLTAVVGRLGDRLKDTEALAQANTSRVKANERKATLIRLLVVFDILLTIGGFWVGFTLFETNTRLDAVCPLFAFSLGTYAPQSRAPGADRDQYIQSFANMRAKFADLGCGPNYPIVPGAAHPPTAAPGN